MDGWPKYAGLILQVGIELKGMPVAAAREKARELTPGQPAQSQ
jgi:hypothetical protein